MMHISVFVLALSLVVLVAAQTHPDDYYAKFNKDGDEHTMVKYHGIGGKCTAGGAIVVKSGPVTEEEKEAFLKFHNDYRRKVAKGQESRGSPGPQPEASNMKEMTWSNELAELSQRWAEQCPDSSHPHDHNRITDDFSVVGQNMFADSIQSTPMFGMPDPPLTANVGKAVKFWTLEAAYMNNEHVSPFTYKPSAGHYSQIVWANSDKLGCGFVMTKKEEMQMFFSVNDFKRVVICNFGPGGNINGLDMYKTGEAGSACPAGTSNNDGLCA